MYRLAYKATLSPSSYSCLTSLYRVIMSDEGDRGQRFSVLVTRRPSAAPRLQLHMVA
jgi:hypothetical protein